MTTRIVACLISLGLHGFLLSQWPSPMVRVPVWHSADSIVVTYLAPAPTTPSPGTPEASVSERRPRALTSLRRPPEPRPPQPGQGPRESVRPGRPLDAGVSVRWTGRAGMVRASSAGATKSSRSEEPPRWDGSSGAGRTAPEAGAIPQLLTPADFAQFRYKQRVRGRLQHAIAYPAGRGVLQGTARLRLTIARDGQVASAACLTADAPLFEEATMAGVIAATPFPTLPTELASSDLTCEFLVAFTPGADTSVAP